MDRIRLRRAVLCAVVATAMLSSAAWAQTSGLTGVVRDTTGAVLPGVTVEARSPALIEQVRTAVTDAEGRYRITALRIGTYSVVFSLTGFTTVTREGIRLEADFTGTVNADLPPGGIEETLTVTGAAPVVDIRSTNRREVLTQELMEVLPSGRNHANLAATLPAVSIDKFDVGGSTTLWTGGASAYGGTTSDYVVDIDGMNVKPGGEGGCVCSYYNDGATEESVYQVNSGDAETQTGGIRVNMIPKEGGNTFSGQVLGLYSNSALQSNNLTQELRQAGAEGTPGLDKLYDVNPGLGGPILRDRLWFFGSARVWTFDTRTLNAFEPNAYETDGTQAIDTNLAQAYNSRFTMQATPRNKLAVSVSFSPKDRAYQMIELGDRDPDATHHQVLRSIVTQVRWTAPVSSRLLLEAGVSAQNWDRDLLYTPFVARPSATLPYGDIPKYDIIKNRYWNAAARGEEQRGKWNDYQAIGSLSYVTGAHAFKVGYQWSWGTQYDLTLSDNGYLTQRYRDGVPDSVQIRNTPVETVILESPILGIYLQDSWVLDRLTLNPGLRFEYYARDIAAQDAPAGRFVPARHFDKIDDIVNWKDVAPRFGASYDVFGKGRTAIKGSVGRYMSLGDNASAYNPMVRSTDTRTWNDLNRDDIAQENELGPTTNQTFGIRRNVNPDPAIEREYQLLYNLAVQHELRPGVGLTVSYNRREFRELTWRDNLATTHADYTLLTTPDPRGTGERLPVYSLNRSRFGLVDELDTNSDRNSRTYDGVDVTFNVRLPGGAVLFGGTSTGRIRSVTCDVDDPNRLRFCDNRDYDIPFRTNFKLSGTYPLPYGFRLSGVLQSLPGAAAPVTYTVNSRIVPGLTQANVPIQLTEPGTEYLERVTQLDFSAARRFQAGGLRIAPKVDLFNMLNASPAWGRVTAFGSSLGRPTSILEARLIRVGVQMDF